MTWTAPAPVRTEGSMVAGERAMLEGFLAWERSTLLVKCTGLTGEQLARQALPPSTLSLLGIIRHMAKVERTWFRQRFDGQDVAPLHAERKDADFEDLDPSRAAGEYALFLDECRLADATTAGRSLDETFTHAGTEYSLRLLHHHMITEYARHNGHADLLREQVDGVTGH